MNFHPFEVTQAGVMIVFTPPQMNALNKDISEHLRPLDAAIQCDTAHSATVHAQFEGEY
jgi:hypothetical protein